ncbi:hypothetical protein QCA50_006360 [Cerrena zonata]|uniref:H-type lectin domain-containing protein n=1 Tax=Cerrena zonata TaxID=2478898 RepID=A0AAW0G8P8_9APHY
MSNRRPVANVQTGTFRTKTETPFGEFLHNNPGDISLGRFEFKSAPPKILLGISTLHLNIPRIRCSIFEVSSCHAKIALESWEGTIGNQYNPECSWLAIARDDPDLQCGRFDTLEDHLMARPQQSTARQIRFARSYSSTPKVVVWLEAISTNPAHDCRVITKATNITCSGFTINIDTWSDTELLCGTAAWLAYSGNRTDIYSGTFSTDDVCRGPPRHQHSSYAPFAGREFWNKPKVFTALNMLNVSNETDLRVKAYTSNVSMNGLTWNIDSWDDTILYGAEAVFVAFDQ